MITYVHPYTHTHIHIYIFIADMYFSSTIMKRSFDTKYLGFKLNAKLYDDDDILK